MSDDSADISLVDEAARRQFEQGWREGNPQPIEQFLPANSAPAYLPTLEELICIELEFAWRNYGKPDVEFESLPLAESYVKRFPGLSSRPVLQRLIKEEYRVRHRFGDRPSSFEYCERFPEVIATAAELETVAEDVRLVDRARAPQAGDRVDQYRLTAEHGRGGLGTVWRAKDTRLRREVAIKQLRRAVASDAHIRLRFVTEARITSQLDHPGIVPVYDMGRLETGEPYYSMKLVRGETLTEVIRRFHDEGAAMGGTHVRHRRLIEMFIAVCRTMDFAHDRGVIHRDLKPDNIILGEFGETLILDWGLAKVIASDEFDEQSKAELEAAEASRQEIYVTQLGAVLGTPAYMSPEQAAGNSESVDVRSDIYSLGAVLYEILTGKRWVSGDSTLDIIEQVRNAAVVRPRAVNPKVSSRLEAICLTAMAKDPADRYQTVQEMTRDLEAYLAFEPVSVCRETLTFRVARWVWRNRNLAAAITGLVLLVFVGAIAWFFVRQADLERQVAQQQFERKQQELQQQQQLRVRDSLEQAERYRDLALARLRAGELADAQRQIRAALREIQDIESTEALRAEFDETLNRIEHLIEFDRFSQAAQMAFSWDRHGEAFTNVEQALYCVGVFDNDRWWEHLPDADLTEAQKTSMRDDILGLMVFHAAAVAVPELGKLMFANRNACREAAELVRKAQAYKETNAGSLVLLCAEAVAGGFNINELSRQLSEFPARVPTSAIDYRLMGVAHLIIHLNQNRIFAKTLLTLIKSDNIGIDLNTPLDTAERYLQDSIRRRPDEYWTHIWLGHTMRWKNDPLRAELAFSSCVALRPHLPDGRASRAFASATRFSLGGDTPDRLESLAEQVEKDVDIALKYGAHIPTVRVVCARSLGLIGEHQRCYRELLEFFDVEIPYGKMRDATLANIMKSLRVEVLPGANNMIGAFPDDPAAYLVLAILHVQVGELEEAEQMVAEGLDRSVEDIDKARGLSVLGRCQLERAKKARGDQRREQLEASLATFEKAVLAWPKHYGACIGRVEAQMSLDRPETVLQLTRYMENGDVAVTQWHRIEMLSYRARAFARLDRLDDARSVIEAIAKDNRRFARALRAELLDAKP
jgi:serine/threonine protein kinase